MECTPFLFSFSSSFSLHNLLSLSLHSHLSFSLSLSLCVCVCVSFALIPTFTQAGTLGDFSFPYPVLWRLGTLFNGSFARPYWRSTLSMASEVCPLHAPKEDTRTPAYTPLRFFSLSPLFLVLHPPRLLRCLTRRKRGRDAHPPPLSLSLFHFSFI